jgi:hypothetical protein
MVMLSSDPLVRLYVLLDLPTGSSSTELAIHSLVSGRYEPITVAGLRLAPLADAVYRAACPGPVAVAEVAVAAGTTVAVARVVLADLIGRRLVRLRPAPPQFDRRLLEEVLDGLRAL